jgi:hypothetical protein
MQYTQHDEDTDAAQTTAEAMQRLNTADYVEARGYLVPSTEFFSRAVGTAEEDNTVTGSLLASVRIMFDLWNAIKEFHSQ